MTAPTTADVLDDLRATRDADQATRLAVLLGRRPDVTGTPYVGAAVRAALLESA